MQLPPPRQTAFVLRGTEDDLLQALSPTHSQWVTNNGHAEDQPPCPRGPNQLCRAIPALEFTTESGWSWSPAETTSSVGFITLHRAQLSWGTTSISHLHKNPCLRLCFQGTQPKTHAYSVCLVQVIYCHTAIYLWRNKGWDEQQLDKTLNLV